MKNFLIFLITLNFVIAQKSEIKIDTNLFTEFKKKDKTLDKFVEIQLSFPKISLNFKDIDLVCKKTINLNLDKFHFTDIHDKEEIFLCTELKDNYLKVGKLNEKWQESGIIYQDESPKPVFIIDKYYNGIEINKNINEADVIMFIGLIDSSKIYGVKAKYKYEKYLIDAGGTLIYGGKENQEDYTGFVSVKGEVESIPLKTNMPFLVLFNTEKQRNDSKNSKPLFQLYGELWWLIFKKIMLCGIAEGTMDLEKTSNGGKVGFISVYEITPKIIAKFKGMLIEPVFSYKQILVEPRFCWKINEKITTQLYHSLYIDTISKKTDKQWTSAELSANF